MFMAFDVEREIRLAALGVVFAILWLVCAFVLFRLVTPWLWGLRTDMAPVAAVAGVLLGVVVLMYLALIMIRATRRLTDRVERKNR